MIMSIIRKWTIPIVKKTKRNKKMGQPMKLAQCLEVAEEPVVPRQIGRASGA